MYTNYVYIYKHYNKKNFYKEKNHNYAAFKVLQSPIIKTIKKGVYKIFISNSFEINILYKK